ncbi:hypothetical protein Q3G72_006189 [Acer saccharum]|nr:hypothetical protein Q3G72_006189 [Acer saccharum]
MRKQKYAIISKLRWCSASRQLLCKRFELSSIPHAPVKDVRSQIMPAARAFPLEKLMDALQEYQKNRAACSPAWEISRDISSGELLNLNSGAY